MKLISDKAKKDKIKVRLLVDAFTHDFNTRYKFTTYLKERGVELRYFNMRAEFNPQNTYRTHIKIFLADGAEYITGGRNVADDYFGLSYSLNFIDRDVYVKGASAQQAQASFDRLWEGSRSEAETASPKWMSDKWAKSCMVWNSREDEIMSAVSKAKKIAGGVSCSQVKFWSDEYNFSGANLLAKKHTSRELLNFIKKSEQILHMENWSYSPWGKMHDAINTLRKKPVGVFVTTNKVTDVGGSMDYLNNKYVNEDNWGTQMIREISSQGSLQDDWALTPKDSFWMIHSKVFVSDYKHAAVTSYNLDARSYHFNLESGMFAYNCPQLADKILDANDKLVATFDKDKSCDVCQKEPTFKFMQKLIGILGESYH